MHYDALVLLKKSEGVTLFQKEVDAIYNAVTMMVTILDSAEE